jgi:hypothetical protein
MLHVGDEEIWENDFLFLSHFPIIRPFGKQIGQMILYQVFSVK